MSFVDIRFCQVEEIDLLQQYLKNNWQHDHVFVKSRQLLTWLHQSSDNNLNYVIAVNEIGEIVGSLGFNSTTHFDNQLSKSAVDVWLALWKANNEYPGVGFAMLRFIEEEINPVSIGAIGINDPVEKNYNLLGFKSGFWDQYFFLNTKIIDFKIASILEINITTNDKRNVDSSRQQIKIIKDLNLLTNTPKPIYKPLKSVNYFINRYTKHPFYKYQIWGIYKEDEIICLLVTRKINVNESFCIRILDVLGDLSQVENLSAEFDQILQKENAEYIDFINYGINEDVFYKIGLQKRTTDNIIIPNYFEPFVQSNINIKFAYKSQDEPYTIFKGDADQDRPNIL